MKICPECGNAIASDGEQMCLICGCIFGRHKSPGEQTKETVLDLEPVKETAETVEEKKRMLLRIIVIIRLKSKSRNRRRVLK
ncbi:MAG: hypothetical protein IJ600_12920 [Lachnospiraceae bacterium]|nr:hypothetical protein [Lachnospiraceae bacterium]